MVLVLVLVFCVVVVVVMFIMYVVVFSVSVLVWLVLFASFTVEMAAWRCGRSSGGDVVKLHAGRYDVISGRQHGFCGYSKPRSHFSGKTGPF